jgi:dihydrolipoamide dehydrogenase
MVGKSRTAAITAAVTGTTVMMEYAPDGFVKIIRDAKYGEILGAHIVGAHATEMIHELVVARENEFTVEEIDLAIHAHPTLSEAIGEAVLDSMGKMLHA